MRRFFITAFLYCLTAPFVGLQAADIYVNGVPVADGQVYTQPFCVNEPIEFSVPTFVYGACTDSVVWDFGDGTSAISTYSETGDIAVEHIYTTQNWYTIRAHCFCSSTGTDEWNSFSIRAVDVQDTIVTLVRKECFSRVYYEEHKEECDELIAHGIDSIGEREHCYDTVHLYHLEYCLEPVECLHMTVTNNPEAQHICPGEDLDITFTLIEGSYDGARFVVPGLLDVEVNIPQWHFGVSQATVTLPVHSIVRAGQYKGELIVEDHYCNSASFPIDFTVNYPEDIFRFKFNNVLAVYNSGFGGNIGYTFTAYQWFLNTKAIEGATESIYHREEPFAVNDVVYVVLTDDQGMTLPSCPQTITEVPDFSPKTQAAPAQKLIINQRIVIRKGDNTYDIYGQRIE